jgi:hypothetical protein
MMLESGIDKFLVFAHHKILLDAAEFAANKEKAGVVVRWHTMY